MNIWIELILLAWGCLYAVCYITTDETLKKLLFYIIISIGLLSIPIFFIFAETAESYLLSCIIFTIVNFVYSNKYTALVAIFLILLGYFIKLC